MSEQDVKDELRATADRLIKESRSPVKEILKNKAPKGKSAKEHAKDQFWPHISRALTRKFLSANSDISEKAEKVLPEVLEEAEKKVDELIDSLK